jgi:flagellar hook protein FlgE
MSLYGALQIGVAGLSADSTAMSISASNIANVNTVGYKDSVSSFSTILASSSGSSDPTEAGVMAKASQLVTSQGQINTTQSPTDLSISGNGFFVVNTTPTATTGASTNILYTRAGNFTPDANGNLRNAAGFYVMGWPLDANGNVPTNRNSMSPISINNLSGKAQATSTMTISANLQASTTATAGYAVGDMAAGTTTPDFERTINVFDSQGGAQPLQVAYLKTGANTWSYEVTYQGAASNLTGPPANNLIGSGTLTFNSDGTLANVNGGSPATGTANITIPWAPGTSGLAPQTVAMNMGTVGGSDGITQFDNPSSLGPSTAVNGALFGQLTGVSINTDGIVTAQFSNGLSQNVFKLPIATFSNPDGLAAVSGNAYTASNDSGTAAIGEANLGGAGSVNSKSLEGSTVDLATEFTNLITTQRAYSASARIITTADQMLQTLEQIQ